MSEPAHICFVSPLGYPVLAGDATLPVIGGAEVQQGMLARALVERGYRVSMISQDFGQREASTLDGVRMIKTHRPDAGLPVARFLHPRLTSTLAALRRADADIYYQRCASMLTGVVAWHCHRRGRRAIFAAAHDTDLQPGDELLTYARDRWLFRWGLRRVDRIVVQNPHQANLCQENYGRATEWVPSCYRLPADARSQRGDYVLWVSTLRPFKRPELLLQIASALPEVRFRMIGGAGGSTPALRKLHDDVRARAQALPNVEFLGFQPLRETERHFDCARMLLNTSASEGFPNTFLQAWARGLPTVSLFDCGSRQAGQPVSSLACDVEDAVARVRQLWTDEGARRLHGARAQTYFQACHSPAAAASRYAEIFEGLLAQA